MLILISLVPNGDHTMETDTQDIQDATVETNTHKDGYEKAVQEDYNEESEGMKEGDDNSVVQVDVDMEESDGSSIVEVINENSAVPGSQDNEARSQEYPLEVITEFLLRKSMYRVKVLV
jgi:hypothetical protein